MSRVARLGSVVRQRCAAPAGQRPYDSGWTGAYMPRQVDTGTVTATPARSSLQAAMRTVLMMTVAYGTGQARQVLDWKHRKAPTSHHACRRWEARTPAGRKGGCTNVKLDRRLTGNTDILQAVGGTSTGRQEGWIHTAKLNRCPTVKQRRHPHLCVYGTAVLTLRCRRTWPR